MAAAVWTWAVGGAPPSGVETRELTRAYGRSLVLRLDAAATAQFTLDGRTSEAAEIAAFATDLTIRRNGVAIFRGRITTEADTVDGDRHTVQFSATDYRGMLAYRVVGASGASYAATDQGTIAFNLISTSQALTGGNWGVTNGLGATSGTLRDRTYDPGKTLLSAIEDLGRVDNGFEWDIDPTLALRRWYPTRQAINGLILDYGGTIAKFTRLLSPADFANSVMATGAQGLTPQTATATIDGKGLWQTSVAYTSVLEQATLATKATWLLGQTSILRPDYSVTFAPGRFEGLTQCGLGDLVQLSAGSGRLSSAVAGFARVVELNMQPGDHGTEVVTAGLVAA